MRKTKIICTLGPASSSDEIIEALILGGMDAARFNFSHSNHEEHLRQLKILRRLSAKHQIPVAAIIDTKGPEIRVKDLDHQVELKTGNVFTLTARDVSSDETIASVTYGDLYKEVSPGTRIMIDDGLIELKVEEVSGLDIICRVIFGGTLSSNKGINLPNVRINMPSLTDRDKDDIRFAAEHGFDYIAASFVRKGADITDIRDFLTTCGGEKMGIISKIENSEGLRNMDEIIKLSDGVMVARGDLGVEIPAHQVPIIQKQLVTKCALVGKPVIIATQLLDSMIRSPRATRAEISDVANAVFEFAGCAMLSGETASGKYPLESLRVMSDALVAAEESLDYWEHFESTRYMSEGTISGAVSRSCCHTAMDVGAKAILAPTTSGHTAKVISRYKPSCDIIAMTTTEEVRRQLSLYWGVKSYLTPPAQSTDHLLQMSVERALEGGDISKGDKVIITAGVPVGETGRTNLIKVQIV